MVYPPVHIGIQEFDDYPLEELRQYIDWTFFCRVSYEVTCEVVLIFDTAACVSLGSQLRELFGVAVLLLLILLLHDFVKDLIRITLKSTQTSTC